VCDGKACEVAFSVKEVHGFEACSRRPVVLPVDARVNAFVSAMIIQLHTQAARGIYQLTLDTQFWDSGPADQLVSFQEELKNTIRYDHAGERCNAAEMSSTQVAALLNKPGSAPLLIQSAATASPSAVKSMRDDFESQSRSAYLSDLMFAAVRWGTSLAALVALVHAIHMFYARLYGAASGRRTVSLLWPMMIQLLIGGVGVAAAVFQSFDMWPGVFLVPAVMVILLSECWSWFRAHRLARRDR
jgi:hypothetical protein